MAVYTEVSDGDLAKFMADYDLGEVTSCKGIAEGVENSNFLVTTQSGPYILTLYEKRVREEDLPYFIGLLQHLHDKGLNCPLPVATKDGEILRHLSGRPACLITFLEGMWPRQIKPAHCHALGVALAQLHLAGNDFTMYRANDLSLNGWEKLADLCRENADTITPGLTRVIDHELAELKQQWPTHLPQGVIHADLFPDNVFFDRNGRLSGLIDFYFACNDLLAYDLAICLNAWCFDTHHRFSPDHSARLLEGYQSVRPLTDDEQAALPLLARGSALRFMLTRAYDWLNHDPNAMVTVKDPLDYLKRLTFHQNVKTSADYGITPPPQKQEPRTCRT